MNNKSETLSDEEIKTDVDVVEKGFGRPLSTGEYKEVDNLIWKGIPVDAILKNSIIKRDYADICATMTCVVSIKIRECCDVTKLIEDEIRGEVRAVDLIDSVTTQEFVKSLIDKYDPFYWEAIIRDEAGVVIADSDSEL